MALILDTNALSALSEGDVNLRSALAGHPELAIPVIVLGEFLFGIHQSRSRARYEQWLDFNMSIFEILAIGRQTAVHYAAIRRELRSSGRPIPSNDLWIAALARESGLPIVTRDRHFQNVRGVRLLAW